MGRDLGVAGVRAGDGASFAASPSALGGAGGGVPSAERVTAQPALFADLGASGVVDPDGLERFYTPDRLAVRIVDTVVSMHERRLAWGLDPHVGGGAFARALDRHCDVVQGVDVDPEAVGLRHVRSPVCADWLTASPEVWRHVDLVAGNPPFSTAADHVAATFRACPRADVVFVLPLTNLGLLAWQPLFRGPSHRLTAVLVIVGRPWTCVREVAAFVWRPKVRTGPETPQVSFLSW